MKTTTQLTVAAVALFTSSFINVASVYYLINRMSDDGRVVNHTGIVRGASQRLVKLELSGEKRDDLIRDVERIIRGLIDGDRTLALPAANDPEFVAKMQAVEEGWQKLKARIKSIRENSSMSDRLMEESEDFFNLTNAAVFAAEDFSKGKIVVTQTSQLVLFGLNLVVLIAIYLVTRSLQISLKKTISTIAASSTEITTIVVQQESVASEQAYAVNQTTASTTQLKASSDLAARQAATTTDAAYRVRNLGLGGTKTVEYSLGEMANLQSKVSTIADKINHLKEQTTRIENISGVVSYLATQTTMLALNAAVEASRVSAEGKGFAVVAAEIRKLAIQSKKSAQQIQTLVAEIQNSINSTVLVTQEGTQRVEKTEQTIQEVAQVFQSVVDAIDEVFVSSEQISDSTKEQAIAIQQVLAAMNAINAGAKETAFGISQTKIGVQQLNDAALGLETMV